MDKKLVRKLGVWTLVFGILAVLLYLLHDIVGAMHYPGYDPMTQAVSDLTAVDAPSYVVASGYTKIYGIFSCLCNVFVCLLMRDHRKPLRTGIYLITAMQFTSAVGYSLFPLTGRGYDGSFQSFMHVYVITVIVVLLSIVSLIFIAAGSFKEGKKLLGIFALITLACFFTAPVSAALPSVFGIVERFSTYGSCVFTLVLSAVVYRESVC